MSSVPASTAKKRFELANYPLAQSTVSSRRPRVMRAQVLRAPYAPNNGKQAFWRPVIVKWASKKSLSLNEIYRRMSWDEAKQWRRRQHPDLRLREAATLALACEAPISQFLLDLVLGMGLTLPGRRFIEQLRKTHRRTYYPRGVCSLCGSTKHHVNKCKSLVTARELLEILRADQLAVLGAEKRRAKAVKKATNRALGL